MIRNNVQIILMISILDLVVQSSVFGVVDICLAALLVPESTVRMLCKVNKGQRKEDLVVT